MPRHVKNGIGRMEYDGGDVYEGAFQDGEPHGQGKLTDADGDVYEGAFQDGKRHGQGKMTYTDGARLRGKQTHADGTV